MPSRKRVLVQWIGHTDLRAMAGALPAGRQKAILDQIGGKPTKEGDNGPVATLLANEEFDEVHVLSNYRPQWSKWFKDWACKSAKVEQVELGKPTDYGEILRIAEGILDRITKSSRDIELCLHLSPGTPAMAAVWLLLGKTRFPATFYETYAGKSWTTEVPFDLTIDVLPAVLRNPDAHLQYLAAEGPSDVVGFEAIAGDSRAIRDAVGRAKRAAMRGVSVLLLGESGTGKELFARAIHESSPRRDKPFEAVNCAALSTSLLESELFGHVKGAYTGADRTRPGAFEAADGGTLFLDEVGECDLETQAKLLRILQPVAEGGPAVRCFRRVGDDRERTVDVRVVAATNKDLHAAIENVRFREDLFYRLAAVTITLPPLRDRRSDVLAIAERLLDRINRQFEHEEPAYEHKQLSPAAKGFVKRHDWPGNVRQLYNVLVQAAVFSDGKTIGKEAVLASLGEMPRKPGTKDGVWDRELGDGFELDELLKEVHTHYLRRAMQEASGVKTQAAKLLGIANYQTLAAQLERFGIADETTSTRRGK
jgi:DNA-binding NtrC family response regulator